MAGELNEYSYRQRMENKKHGQELQEVSRPFSDEALEVAAEDSPSCVQYA